MVEIPWKSFPSDLLKYVKQDTSQFDVTLICDEGLQVKAHKIILSTASDFLKEILCSLDETNTYILLNEFKKHEVEKVLGFIYGGEVELMQADFEKFLHLSRMLGILDLGTSIDDINRDGCAFQEAISIDRKNISITLKPQKLSVVKSSLEPKTLQEVDCVNINEMINEKSQLRLTSVLSKKDAREPVMIDGLWECPICGRTFIRKYHAKCHTNIHFKSDHRCDSCSKSFGTQESLRSHVRMVHCDEVYMCSTCGKTGMNRVNFKNHKYYSKSCGSRTNSKCSKD